MSLHYSKFSLNTWCGTPYFLAQLPTDYPLGKVLLKCRAFRRLPPNLRELAAAAKQWAVARNPDALDYVGTWYDNAGYELDPDTGRRLTDAEIDAQWSDDPALAKFRVTDLPKPPGGFPDPETWEPPARDEEEKERPTRGQLLRDVAARGREATAEEYDLPLDQVPEAEYSLDDFPARAKRVLTSPYLRTKKDREFMVEALAGADTYDDLGGRALEMFDAAEAADE